MEIVVTTPHGDGDICVTNWDDTTTLAEIITLATGQAAPAIVRVDGRTTESATTLARSGLLRGSVVDTVPDRAEIGPITSTTLAQIAGPGAGRRHTLVGGRHRLGPGRRVNAAELSSAPVEEPVVTIDVGTDGSVKLHPADGHPLTLGGTPVEEATTWNGAVAVIGDRAFVIDRDTPARGDPADLSHRRAAPDGTVAFQRSPLTAEARVRRPAIDAVHDAVQRGPGLWQRRSNRPGAFVVPIGIDVTTGSVPPEIVTIDLAAERVVSIVGPRRSALARTVLLEATTLLGPADLDVVIATTSEGGDDWDWAKWLPHARATGKPAILHDSEEIAAWSIATVAATADARSDHLTVLVVDDPELWNRRDTPLHRLLIDPPDRLRVVTLSATSADTPPTATRLLTEDADRGWRCVSTTTADRRDHVLAALVETEVARRAAIAMAPLDDQDAPAPVRPPDPAPRPLRSVAAPVGRPVIDELVDHVVDGAVIVGAEHETARTAATFALRRCLDRPCWLLDLLGSPWTEGLRGLAGRCDTDLDSDTVDVDRVLARLRHHRDADQVPGGIVVLVDADRPAGARLMGSVAELDGITVFATASSQPGGTTLPVVRVERHRGRRRATIDGLGHPAELDDDPDTGELSVRAMVSGRPLTALERRVEREATRHPEAFVAQCRALVLEFASDTVPRPPVLARPPLPAPLSIDSLFTRFPGDAVPIGLVDDPADDHEVLWWRPEDGHLIAIGPSLAGLDGLVATALAGIVNRYGDDEFEVVHVAAADDAAVAAVLDRIGSTDGTPLVLAVDDLGALRDRAEALGDDGTVDTAVVSRRITLVGRASTLEAAGAVANDTATTLLVVSPGDHGGRCRLAADGRVVQLAGPDRSASETWPEDSRP